jgi:PST family polysaccharide transporter
MVSLVTLAAFAAGIPFGVANVAFFYTVSGLVIQVPAIFYITGRSGPIRTKDLWVSMLWHLPVWGIVCGVAWLVRQRTLGEAAWIQLLAAGSAGLIAGLGFVCIWPRSRRVALNVIDIVRQALKSGSKKTQIL